MHEMLTVVTDVSVCLSRMHRITLRSEAGLRLAFAVRGHSMQPLRNHFGHLLAFLLM